MNSDKICFDAMDIPSGHSRLRTIPYCNVQPVSFASADYKLNYSCMPNFKNFAGPYKEYEPPGNRTPAVGEKIWGDVPYLPSYLDPMYHKSLPATAPDNLYFRGPFFKGVSETHSEFVNRGVLPKRQYHDYVRHYEEPGMKNDKSVTQTDFTPPLPMLTKDESPCLKEEPSKPWYEPDRKPPKNPHTKELEMRPRDPVVVYVDDVEGKRDFSTEHNDNYICYQKSKTGTKIRDPQQAPGEIFLKNLRENHQRCLHSPPPDDLCDGSCKVPKRCPGATSKRTSWLLHPKNYSFRNGVMLIPCKCRFESF